MLKNIKVEIEKVKKELDDLVKRRNNLTEKDIVELSQRLDLLINKYYA